MLRVPPVIVNFKAYSEAVGENALRLARVAAEVSEETGVEVGICPPHVDLRDVVREVGDEVTVLAQAVDAAEPGGRTGHVTPEMVVEAGADGTLLNHSERRMLLEDLKDVCRACMNEGLLTIVCASDALAARAAGALSPHAVAVEPPELIGTGTPVSKADPEVVERSVEVVKEVSEETAVLCGAGITDGSDVRAAVELGADGVLVASGVVLAGDPKEALLDLISGLE
ncbi:triose-phosphate isomerase [Methanopyrus kandleri]